MTSARQMREPGPDDPPQAPVRLVPSLRLIHSDTAPEPTVEQIVAALPTRSAEASLLLLDALAASEEPVPAGGMVEAFLAAGRLMAWATAQEARWLAAFARPGVAVPLSEVLDAAMSADSDLSVHADHPLQPSDQDLGDQDRAYSDSAVYGDPSWDAVVAAHAARFAEPEVSAAMLVAPITARRRLDRALELVDELPYTLLALEAGEIDGVRARVIAESVNGLSADLKRAVERAVLPFAAAVSPGELGRRAIAAAIVLDPDAAADRAESARQGRGVGVRNLGADLARFHADLDAGKALLALAVLDDIADHLPDDAKSGRGPNQVRADIFADLFAGLAETGHVDLRGNAAERPDVDECSAHGGRVGNTDHDSGDFESTGDTVYDSADGHSTDNTVNDSADGHSTDNTINDSADGHSTDNTINDSADGHSTDNTDNDSANVENTDNTSSARTPNATDFRSSQNCADDRSDSESAYDRSATDYASPDNPLTSASTAFRRPGRRPSEPAGLSPAIQVNLDVTVSMSTLAGLDNCFGLLSGHGSITADLARSLASAARTVRLIATRSASAAGSSVLVSAGDPPLVGELAQRDPSDHPVCHPGCVGGRDCGTEVDYGRRVYRPPVALADQVRTRDQRCRFPGCGMIARRCDLDHRDPYRSDGGAGGVTCPCNLDCLCRFHHRAKTFTGWSAVRTGNTMNWTSPLGRSYTDHPPDLPLGKSFDAADLARRNASPPF